MAWHEVAGTGESDLHAGPVEKREPSAVAIISWQVCDANGGGTLTSDCRTRDSCNPADLGIFQRGCIDEFSVLRVVERQRVRAIVIEQMTLVQCGQRRTCREWP